jgi:hypothetical protein
MLIFILHFSAKETHHFLLVTQNIYKEPKAFHEKLQVTDRHNTTFVVQADWKMLKVEQQFLLLDEIDL